MSRLKYCLPAVAAILIGCTSLTCADEAAKPVDVKLFGEALCPYCAHFTVQTVAPLFKLGLGNIFNFTYIAYGNALNSSETGVVCQHGPLECKLNTVINCAQHLHPGQEHWFPYVACLESNMAEGEEAAHKCADDLQLDWDRIQQCATGELGAQLDVAAADATNNLQPAHTYVPWVVVNGVPVGSAYMALQAIVCVAYQGERPEACKAVPPTLQLGAVTELARKVPVQHEVVVQ